MKKIWIIIISVVVVLAIGATALCLSLGSCNQSADSSSGSIEKPEPGKPKLITGIDPCFEEDLQFYNESPSVLRVGNTQYLFYTRNEVASDENTSAIFVRKATFESGKWNYGEPKKVLSRSSEGWDSVAVFAADVIKGEFSYKGTTYSYLMAYNGSKKANRNNAQIGFAVSNEIDGEYIRVGNAPVVEYDKTTQTPVGLTNFKGVVEPSMVSYDMKGKLTLFYTFYGKFNSSYALEMDCSNLESIKKSGRMKINVAGLTDGYDNTTLYGGDYVYNPDDGTYVVCRNYGGAVSGLPSVSEAVQIVTCKGSEMFRVDSNTAGTTPEKVWSLYNGARRRISAIHTAIDDLEDMSRSNGYKRIYNGCIASDVYGYALSTRNVEIYFTSSAVSGDEGLVGNEYLFSPMIHEYHLARG